MPPITSDRSSFSAIACPSTPDRNLVIAGQDIQICGGASLPR